jgi:predicted outer membrane protein
VPTSFGSLPGNGARNASFTTSQNPMNFDPNQVKTALIAAAFAVSVPGLAFAQDADEPDAVDDSGMVVIEGDTEPAEPYLDGPENQKNGQDRKLSPEAKELDQATVKKWFGYAASGHQYEIEAAKLAQQQIDDQQLVEFAKSVEQDHMQALDTLRKNASEAGIEIADSPELMPVHEAMLEGLKEKQGNAFKRAFVFGQDSGHRLMILEYAWAQENVKNQPVQQYVNTVLPIIREHHDEIHDDARQLAGLGSGTGYDETGEARLAGDRQGGTDDFSDDPVERYFQERDRDLEYESELNRMAADRGNNDQIRSYAEQQQQRVDQERSQLQDQARQAGYDLEQNPIGLSDSQRTRLQEIERGDRESFDREYVFEKSQQSFRRGLNDAYFSRSGDFRQSESGQFAQQSAQQSMQANQQRQRELQQLLLIIMEPTGNANDMNDMGGDRDLNEADDLGDMEEGVDEFGSD